MSLRGYQCTAGDGDVVNEVAVQVVNLCKKINKRESMRQE
jgi:hypothetical protein